MIFRAGFKYGLRFWKAPWNNFDKFRAAFPKDTQFVRYLRCDYILKKHGPNFLLFCDLDEDDEEFRIYESKFPRDNKKNPWHTVDLEDFISVFTADDKILANGCKKIKGQNVNINKKSNDQL